jgi:hypothetical protein
MSKKHDTSEVLEQAPSNALDALRAMLADAVAIGVVKALRDPSIASMLRTSQPPEDRQMKRAEYARSRGISGAVVSRLVGEGMPVVPVGSSYRIDPIAADAWRAARGRVPLAVAKAKSVDDVDVDADLAKAGIRRRTA